MARDRRRLGAQVFALSLLTWLGTPNTAHACKCMPGATTASESAKGAGAVFEGRVLSGTSSIDGNLSAVDPGRWEVEVLRTWKGKATPGSRVTVVAATSESYCGRSYGLNHSYLFYVSAGKKEFGDSMCSRTMPSGMAGADFADLGPADGNWDESRQPPPRSKSKRDPKAPMWAGYLPEQQPRATAEATPAPTPTQRGCTLQAQHSPSGWLWLLPALALMRRRR